MTKLYYNYTSKGYLIGSRQARKNPLEKDVYLLPAFATFEKPPEIIKRKNIRWDGKKWIYEDVPKEVKEPEPEPTAEELLETAKKQAVSNRIAYLQSTDWYIAREVDQLNTYPQEIKDKRILARKEINQIEQETDIKKIVIDFS